MRKAHAETSFNSPRMEIGLDTCAVEILETFFLLFFLHQKLISYDQGQGKEKILCVKRRTHNRCF